MRIPLNIGSCEVRRLLYTSMSGHSHWHSIRHQKSKEDQKKGRLFSKLSRLLAVAAREGQDPDFNPKLRQAIEEAKEADMPKQNIEKAIERGAGKMEGAGLEAISYEAIGPGNSAFIIEAITDNKNRTLVELKQALKQNNAKLVDKGAVRYLFERKGLIVVGYEGNDKQKLELQAIEAGAEDLVWRQVEGQQFLEVITSPDELYDVKERILDQGLAIETAGLAWVPQKEIELSNQEAKQCQNLVEALSDHDDVQEIYSNVNF